MDFCIKLKDGYVTKIETDSDYEKERDYYGYSIQLFDNIYVYFTSNTGEGYRLHLYARDVELTTFLSFFYGVDFSDMTMETFSVNLENHLGGLNPYAVVTSTRARYERQDAGC